MSRRLLSVRMLMANGGGGCDALLKACVYGRVQRRAYGCIGIFVGMGMEIGMEIRKDLGMDMGMDTCMDMCVDLRMAWACVWTCNWSGCDGEWRRWV